MKGCIIVARMITDCFAQYRNHDHYNFSANLCDIAKQITSVIHSWIGFCLFVCLFKYDLVSIENINLKSVLYIPVMLNNESDQTF